MSGQKLTECPTPEEVERLLEIARAVSTPGEIDSAPEIGEYGHKERGQYLECPSCGGAGHVDGSTFCNFDDKPLGVQFFGIGAEPKEWEAYFRAFRPETAIALLSALQAKEEEVDRLHLRIVDCTTTALGEIGDLEASLSEALEIGGDLRDYVGHMQGCASFRLGSKGALDCDCGMDEALERLFRASETFTRLTKDGDEAGRQALHHQGEAEDAQ